jgi:hypothetical protein
MITQKDIARMTEGELAVLASKAPQGFTTVFGENGMFCYCANWVLEQMSPSQRSKITVISRAH